ncbi:MAG: HDIG domain-containing protein [Dehalococcoidia bacterium]|jgi:putative nucleotidyltransferase with HDIG domain|nr:HDIG domain-containing protein [Dehalococcoidia bacterium]
MDRDNTVAFLRQHVKTEMLMKHLFTVEAAMRGYARKFGEDEDKWGTAGLLHDFDWEICPTPEDHPTFGAQILRDHGYPEEMVRAVLTHGDHTGIPRESRLEHTLYAVDELSGFIRAVALVRPSKSLDDVSPRSVRRKMKDKAFAKDVSRDDIVRGAEELNIDLDEHIAFIVESMKPIAGQIDLAVGDSGS